MEQEQTSVRAFIERHAIPISIVIAGVAIGIGLAQSGGSGAVSASTDYEKLAEEVIPSKGVALPVRWGELGKKLVQAGAIDATQMRALYQNRGGFPAEYERLLTGNANGKLVMNRENAGYLLNLFWALGLANKNPILEDKTEMMNPAYGGAGGFASTGGWTLAKGPSTGSGQGDAMDYYDKLNLVPLTAEQQKLVDKISRGIFRPCCGNSVHFPDCNHGMAMLGLLELMANQGASEKEMWDAALAANSYWFPDTYATIALYMQGKGVDWKNVDPKEMLSADYSSADGFQNIASRVSTPAGGGGGGCGVDAGTAAASVSSGGSHLGQQSGCGI